MDSEPLITFSWMQIAYCVVNPTVLKCVNEILITNKRFPVLDNSFILDSRLESDTFLLAESRLSQLLLMNNAALPWLILVPRTSVTELCDLNRIEAQQLNEEIRLLSLVIRRCFSIDKLNVAAIGNVVKQLHVHIIGRRKDDYCWPNPVWGTPTPETYSTTQADAIRDKLYEHIAEQFSPINEAN